MRILLAVLLIPRCRSRARILQGRQLCRRDELGGRHRPRVVERALSVRLAGTSPRGLYGLDPPARRRAQATRAEQYVPRCESLTRRSILDLESGSSTLSTATIPRPTSRSIDAASPGRCALTAPSDCDGPMSGRPGAERRGPALDGQASTSYKPPEDRRGPPTFAQRASPAPPPRESIPPISLRPAWYTDASSTPASFRAAYAREAYSPPVLDECDRAFPNEEPGERARSRA